MLTSRPEGQRPNRGLIKEDMDLRIAPAGPTLFGLQPSAEEATDAVGSGSQSRRRPPSPDLTGCHPVPTHRIERRGDSAAGMAIDQAQL
jgi:hypothetical protein